MNSTIPAQSAPSYFSVATLVIAALGAIGSVFLVVLKKDGILDRFWPASLPRKKSYRKVEQICQDLSHIKIQIQNLTPPTSSAEESSENNNNNNVRPLSNGPDSPSGPRRDWRSDRVQDVQGVRVPPSSRRASAHSISSGVAQQDWTLRGDPLRSPQGQRRLASNLAVCQDGSGWPHRSPGRRIGETADSTSWDAQSCERPAIRTSASAPIGETDCDPPSPGKEDRV